MANVLHVNSVHYHDTTIINDLTYIVFMGKYLDVNLM